MNPNESNPLLQALFDDDAWRASSLETQAQAGACLRRRRHWRRWRKGMTAAAMVAGVCWLASVARHPQRPGRGEGSNANPAGEVLAFDEVRLNLALNLPVATGGSLTVPAYDPLPDWTFHCEPLASRTRSTP